MPDTNIEIGKLIAGQQMMQESIASLARSVESIAGTQTQILEIQAKHSSNAEMIDKNAKGLSAVHRRLDPVELDVDRNTAFRKISARVFWIVITPVLAASGITSFVLIAASLKG